MNEREKTGGRQAGTPNKATAIIRQRISEADPIGFMIQVAKGESIGDSPAPTLAERIKANEWLGRKLTPDAKERQISFKVPKIEKPADALKAIAGVIEALGDGKVTPSEANAVCGVVGQYIKAYEANEIDERLTNLEKRPVSSKFRSGFGAEAKAYIANLPHVREDSILEVKKFPIECDKS